MSNLSNTDWDTVTVIGSKARIGGSGPRQNVSKSQGALNAARRSGNVVSTEKKYNTGNSKGDPEGQKLAKIDRENEVAPPKKIDASVGKAISKARLDKKMTQKDLATKVNEKQNVINDYEAGRAVPNQQLLAKLEKTLGVKLRGKNIGEPLFPKKK
ncbi:hypothetical protein PACTADRAFT_48656 [Pachysolen tannophilus NRRL Y-2460]|uniref:HTH cro/C1-type domain-containing protein n=1 Tax=Pachysolen tannophilus NRRL Y-2460 TaxID=669874 RepID=A0A1E4TYU8_PACTA|nr:hypothetical protein PACTADRAFT_48656 [Pachysolen tannophilus NRRL Y-2460]